jgi:uncharacterized repeat protein (TIGR03803 family)
MATKVSTSSRFAQLLAATLALVVSASAQASEKVILSFAQSQGIRPLSALVADGNGNFYGTTTSGGANNCGSLFELSQAAGKWTETTLYSCTPHGPVPNGPLTFDKSGNIYGVTQSYNSGSILEFTRGANGTWTESVVHQFPSSEGMPNLDLTLDSSGNLYGTTQLDSTGYNGEVFQLSPQSGTWNETILYKFPAPDRAGAPAAGVIFDSKGNLYGPTLDGLRANDSGGGVYELSPRPSGPWTFTLIYSFSVTLGGGPFSRLVFDSNGNLYGAAAQGNIHGIIFQLTPDSNSTWKETTLHTFDSGIDGYFPTGAPIFDQSGNLYGSTLWGGNGCNENVCGIVYELSPNDEGGWKETILHRFESATDGSEPNPGVVLDSSGNLYGTTYFGGSRYGYGTIYEITP